ncbi:MAG: enoyl-CoA hydratase [Actinomycetia bacterium]|nr:enoyl-CoA hydratase [Actinomycetes bacterium]
MAHLRLERHDGVAVITLDDPARRNALSLGLCAELVDTMAVLEADEDVTVVVVTGAGKAFCAGADLTQLGDSREEGLRSIYDGFLAVAASRLPTIAAVNGPAVGAGLNLALACDLRIAGTDARFDCRFLDLGIHPGGGHTWMLRRIVGPQTAAAMVLFGQILGAEEAVEAGLAWEAAPAESLMERALMVAARATSTPRKLIVDTKATLCEVADIDRHTDAVDHELAKQVTSMDTPEFSQRLADLRARINAD